MHIKCELFAIIFRKECKVQISMKMFHENNKVFELRKITIFYLFSSGADTELNTGDANLALPSGGAKNTPGGAKDFGALHHDH